MFIPTYLIILAVLIVLFVIFRPSWFSIFLMLAIPAMALGFLAFGADFLASIMLGNFVIGLPLLAFFKAKEMLKGDK